MPKTSVRPQWENHHQTLRSDFAIHGSCVPAPSLTLACSSCVAWELPWHDFVEAVGQEGRVVPERGCCLRQTCTTCVKWPGRVRRYQARSRRCHPAVAKLL